MKSESFCKCSLCVWYARVHGEPADNFRSVAADDGSAVDVCAIGHGNFVYFSVTRREQDLSVDLLSCTLSFQAPVFIDNNAYKMFNTRTYSLALRVHAHASSRGRETKRLDRGHLELGKALGTLVQGQQKRWQRAKAKESESG